MGQVLEHPCGVYHYKDRGEKGKKRNLLSRVSPKNNGQIYKEKKNKMVEKTERHVLGGGKGTEKEIRFCLLRCPYQSEKLDSI